MTSPVKLNFKVYQGSTFKEVLRWESSTKVTALTNTDDGLKYEDEITVIVEEV